MAFSSRALWLVTGLAALPPFSCVRFSAFEVDPSADERDVTEKSLRALGARNRAPASRDEPLSFAFLSDTHDGYDQFRGIVSAINARPELEFVLHAGDLTDFGTQQEYHWAY